MRIVLKYILIGNSTDNNRTGLMVQYVLNNQSAQLGKEIPVILVETKVKGSRSRVNIRKKCAQFRKKK